MNLLKYITPAIFFLLAGCSEQIGTEPGQGNPSEVENRIDLIFEYAHIFYHEEVQEGQETANYVIQLADVETNEYGMYVSTGNILSIEIIMPLPDEPESLIDGDYVYRFPTERPYSIIASMYSYFGAVSIGNNIDKQYMVVGEASIRNGTNGNFSMTGEIRTTSNQIVEFTYSGPAEYDTWVPYGKFKYGTAYYFGSVDNPDLAHYLVRLTNMKIGENLDIKGEGQAAYLFMQTPAGDPKFYFREQKYIVFNPTNVFDDMLMGQYYTRAQTRSIRNNPTDYYILDGSATFSQVGTEYSIGMELRNYQKSFNWSFKGELEFIDRFDKMYIDGVSPRKDHKYLRYYQICLISKDYDRNANKGDSISILIGTSSGFGSEPNPQSTICYFGANNRYSAMDEKMMGNELLDDDYTLITTGDGSSFESRKVTAGFVCIDGFGVYLHGKLLDDKGEYWDLAGVKEERPR